TGSDVVSMCYPRPQTWCTRCEVTSADASGGCGTEGKDFCVQMGNGSFCVTHCAADGDCPSGASCVAQNIGGQQASVCVPDSGLCVDCVDEDTDGYGASGQNSECADHPGEDDCDDQDADVHPGAATTCDGLDDACQGR